MERLVEAGNSGPQGRHRARVGAVATDPNTVTFTLAGANGNFPYLVSVFNAQTLITPKAYATGTTLDKTPERHRCLEARQLRRRDRREVRPATTTGGAARRRSTAREFIFFDETGPMVTAYQGGQVDAHRPVRRAAGRSRCSTTRTSRVVETPAANHRQIWMRCDKGQFTDKRVRQALA